MPWGVKSGARLVEHERIGAVDERARDEDAARLAGGHGHDVLIGQVCDTHLLERGTGAAACVVRRISGDAQRQAHRAGQAAGDDVDRRQMHRYLRLHSGRHDAERAADVDERRARIAAEQHRRHVAVQRHDLAGYQFDERRFARPVGSEDGDVFALGDFEMVDVEDDAAGSANRRIGKLQKRNERLCRDARLRVWLR
jgi:hypothetical protein